MRLRAAPATALLGVLLGALLSVFPCAIAPVFAQSSPAAAGSAPASPMFTINEYVIDGDNPIGDAAARAVLAPFLGPNVSLERLQAAAEALELALHDAGHGFYRVVVPPQEGEGKVRLKTLAFTVGTVSVRNNQSFSEANIRASLPALREGTSPNTAVLARDLALANENPSKRVVAAFKQGEKPDTVDANLETTDSRPLSATLSVANTGTQTTGMSRATFAVSHANLFDRDHQGTFSYTTSPERPSQVEQFGAYYRVPVYGWGGMVSAYYSTSTVNSGTVANFFNVTGRGTFMGITYTQYFAPRGDYRDYVTIGIDDKYFDNSQLPGSLNSIRSRPIAVSYTARNDASWGVWGFNADYARNWAAGGANDSAIYGVGPPAGASAQWDAWRFGGDLSARLPRDWLFNGRVRGQWARSPMIAGEQFGVGGAQSVRGFLERAVGGDAGVQASVELWTPPLVEGLRLLGFVDYGRIYNHAGRLPVGELSSVGVGVRWQAGSNVSLSTDYAQVQRGIGTTVRGHDRLHVSLLLRF